MNMRDLIPWGRNSNPAPTNYRGEDQNTFLTLHREMNRLFDDMWRSFDAPTSRFGQFWPMATSNWPHLEIAETDQEVRVTAEVAGLDEKDIEVLVEDDVLTLRGEKRAENEDKDRHFSERFYGQFERRIPLGVEVEDTKATASFKNGLLTIVLPKSAKAQSKAKRIAINGQGQVH